MSPAEAADEETSITASAAAENFLNIDFALPGPFRPENYFTNLIIFSSIFVLQHRFIMTKKDRFSHILAWFEKNRPVAETELHYASPFQLLIAVILSAQCTDKRVNTVTPALFERFPDTESLASAEFDELFPFVSSVSYPNSKTKHLIGMAGKLLSDFGGKVPSGIDELMSLPGVGRKTANVIASVVYDKPVIAVDTHVFRVAHRLGLSDGKTVDAVEKELERYIPEQLRAKSHHWLILHGRYVCTARAPKCGDCPLQDWCRQFASDNLKIK